MQKRTLTPKWEEDKWLLVQEPKTQIMRVQVFDHDVVNLKASPCLLNLYLYPLVVHFWRSPAELPVVLQYDLAALSG